MAECNSCHTALAGTWNMTSAGPPYERTGRYLGITNGYLFNIQSNWVYCYCLDCWKVQLAATVTSLNLPQAQEVATLQQQKNTLTQDNTNLQQQKTALTQEVATLQQQKNILTQDNTNLQQQKTTLTQEVATLQQQKNILTQDNTNLQQQKTTLMQEVDPLQQQKDALTRETTTLVQQVERFQLQLEHHNAVEVIYEAARFKQLRELVKGLAQDEVQVLRDVGFDTTALAQQLEEQHKSSTRLFVSGICENLSHRVGQHLEQLQRSIGQADAGVVNLEQGMRDAGLPNEMIASMLLQIRQHGDGLREKQARWQRFKVDVDAVNQNPN